MASEPRHATHDGADAPPIGNRAIAALVLLAVALAVIGLFVPVHGAFDVETWWSFYGIAGLVGATLAVLIARLLRPIVTRPEDCHDR